jgi:protein-S-isoprenylcysteine O-methyltransferase Ste14
MEPTIILDQPGTVLQRTRRLEGAVDSPYSITRRVVAWALVLVQLALVAGLVWLPGDREWSLPFWLAVLAVAMVAVAAVAAVAAALRLGTGMTASPLPSAAAQLQTTGMYTCVRHPIYAALLLGGGGVVLLGGRVTRVWVWLALLALLLVKSWLEEAALRARFAGYDAYAATTPRLIPNPLRCLARSRSG